MSTKKERRKEVEENIELAKKLLEEKKKQDEAVRQSDQQVNVNTTIPTQPQMTRDTIMESLRNFVNQKMMEVTNPPPPPPPQPQQRLQPQPPPLFNPGSGSGSGSGFGFGPPQIGFGPVFSSFGTPPPPFIQPSFSGGPPSLQLTNNITPEQLNEFFENLFNVSTQAVQPMVDHLRNLVMPQTGMAPMNPFEAAQQMRDLAQIQQEEPMLDNTIGWAKLSNPPLMRFVLERMPYIHIARINPFIDLFRILEPVWLEDRDKFKEYLTMFFGPNGPLIHKTFFELIDLREKTKESEQSPQSI